ncbi:ABC transporter permease subunit [Candidatus Bipolaricaulota bacterium]|nr:ABC transporter permease subunit [Candidatus Bipolaricaulota bacterium]
MKIRSLLVKEFKETRIQGVVFAAVILLFGATSVLLQKFIPQLVPENLAEAFEPSLTAGLADYVGNSLQMGSIVAILITIAALAGERETGTLELLLARPVSKTQIVLSKFFARVSYVFLGNLIAGLVTWYYAVYLFGPFPLGKIMLAALGMSVVISFVVGLTMIFSAWSRSKISAAFGSGAVALALAILPIVKSPYDMISPFTYGEVARQSLLDEVTVTGYLADLGAIIGFTAFCIILTIIIFRKVEKIT